MDKIINLWIQRITFSIVVFIFEYIVNLLINRIFSSLNNTKIIIYMATDSADIDIGHLQTIDHVE